MTGCSLIGLCGTAHAQSQPAAPTTEQADTPVVTVLGSRIPRSRKEGPAPVTTITSEQIREGGYASVPDVMRTVSQNSGETQSQQSGDAADFSPGAQAVDLRGLGPNHTLVMVNGRRVADYPMPYNGSANFTDISNLPIGMIERVEILSGSASAIYGSDALAGVVNFRLKDHPDGSTIDYRYGWTDHGGGMSHKLSGSTGFDLGRFHGVVGGEILKQDPIYGYQRKRQDSTLDAPADSGYQVPVTNWQRLDQDLYYANDATQAQCALTTGTNGGTTHYAVDDYYGDGDTIAGAYCGSESAVGYRTIQSRHDAINLVGSFTFDLSDTTHLFTDIQFGRSKVELLKRPTSWSYEDESGDDTGSFWNSHDGIGDNWYRIFTPEEMGGLDKAMRHVDSTTLTLTPGIRGTFGADDKWKYEASFNYSLYDSRVTFPLINFRKANALFLGAQQGVDDDTGLPVFDADPTRFYTPLTPAQYASIAEDSIYKPKSAVGTLSAQVETANLFTLPAGPVGFAAVVEMGRQDYDLGTDPKATTPYYFSWIDSPGKGHRTHWATGVEFSIPVLSQVEASLAGRYDHFNYAGHDVGAGTYNLGLEYRPFSTLLLRAAYGTGFRAPDLNYVYKGVGYVEGSDPDYYQCLSADPSADPSDCDDVRFQVQTSGSKALRPETSRSFNTGIVWSPSRAFDISIDYFKIDMAGEVEDLDVDPILRDEAECRLGTQTISSPTCQDAIARVVRNGSGDIRYVVINPINVSKEATSGLDLSAHVRIPTPIGQVSLTGSYTHAFDHTYIRYTGDAELDKLAYDSDYYIPRDKASFSVNLKHKAWTFNIDGNYTGRLPNYDEDAWVKPYITYNASISYDINEKLRISLAIDNLLDTAPPHDNTWVSYPYYNANWYDGVGRSGFLQLTYKFK
ncbi:TonB-dependent receptor domain-containing protein [Asticcacaulis solisilvae]|uniref:TonB-dependent receptor domain-containing protein n=1 Tax=Asticcacaulis solisilvae TaxID=1217274 RepID=UPI003FD766FC